MLSWYELGKKEQMEPEQSSLERCIESVKPKANRQQQKSARSKVVSLK